MNFKCPKGEEVCVYYQNADHELMFVMTSKPGYDLFYLYGLDNDEFKKLGKAKTPTELEIKFDVRNKLQQKKAYAEDMINGI